MSVCDTLEFFSNDRYFVLKVLEQNQIKVKDTKYVPLSQQEIADIAHFSKLKTNRLIRDLIDNECVSFFNGKRGKYALTDKGREALRIVQSKYNVKANR